jgi:hypothetical protein
MRATSMQNAFDFSRPARPLCKAILPMARVCVCARGLFSAGKGEA